LRLFKIKDINDVCHITDADDDVKPDFDIVAMFKIDTHCTKRDYIITEFTSGIYVRQM